jgi:hypothetical protein
MIKCNAWDIDSGVYYPRRHENITYYQLSAEERDTIAYKYAQGVPLGEIARALGRKKSRVERPNGYPKDTVPRVTLFFPQDVLGANFESPLCPSP